MNKARSLTLTLMILTVGINYAGPVYLAQTDVLQERFKNTPFLSFIENTDLIDSLAGKKMHIGLVIHLVGEAIKQYEKFLSQNMPDYVKEVNKQSSYIILGLQALSKEIVSLILEDSSNEIKNYIKIFLAQKEQVNLG